MYRKIEKIELARRRWLGGRWKWIGGARKGMIPTGKAAHDTWGPAPRTAGATPLVAPGTCARSTLFRPPEGAGYTKNVCVSVCLSVTNFAKQIEKFTARGKWPLGS